MELTYHVVLLQKSGGRERVRMYATVRRGKVLMLAGTGAWRNQTLSTNILWTGRFLQAHLPFVHTFRSVLVWRLEMERRRFERTKTSSRHSTGWDPRGGGGL